MTFLEDPESELSNRTKLSLWVNTKNKLWLEMGPEGEEDQLMTQGMQMDLHDAKMLLYELNRLIKDLESIPDSETIQPKVTKPEQLTLSKVDWNK